jgi:hypothetical protein
VSGGVAVIERLVAADSLRAVKIRVDTRVELVQQVRFVGTCSIGRGTGTRVLRGTNVLRGTGRPGGGIEAGVSMMSAATVGGGGALSVDGLHVANLIMGAAIVDVRGGSLAVGIHAVAMVTEAMTVAIRVDARIGLISKVGGVGTSSGMMSIATNSSEAGTGGSVGAMTKTTAIAVRVDTRVKLIGGVRRVRAGSSVV